MTGQTHSSLFAPAFPCVPAVVNGVVNIHWDTEQCKALGFSMANVLENAQKTKDQLHKWPQRSLAFLLLQGKQETGLRRNKKQKQKTVHFCETLNQAQRCNIELQKESWDLGVENSTLEPFCQIFFKLSWNVGTGKILEVILSNSSFYLQIRNWTHKGMTY